MKVVALVSDLMDRSKLSATIEGVTFARTTAECRDAEPDAVIVDLARFAPMVAEVREALPNTRIAAFGPHVDEAAASAAAAAGADVVWPRSRFFRDPAAVLEGLSGRPS